MILIDILDAVGVEYKYSSADHNEVTLCCPFCVERGENEDIRFRLGLNIRKGIGHCYNCNWKSGVAGYTVAQLGRVFNIRVRGLSRLTKEIVAKPKPVQKANVNPNAGLPAEYERFGEPSDNIQKKARRYLTQRGVSTLQIVRHRIGYAIAGTMAWRILFPVIDRQKNVVGCVGRDFGGSSVKYLNTPGMKSLWGAEFEGSHAVVGEGVMDALRIEQALLSLHSAVALARLGSTITRQQLTQLKQYEKVTILPDNDIAGVNGAISLAEAASDFGIQCSVAIPEAMDGSDPGSMTLEAILSAINDAKSWNAATKLKLRASKVRI